jgi:hypothetical protein
MRKSLPLLLIAATVAATFGLTSAFRPAAPQASQFMQVTTIESIIPGGLGRSRIITTNPDGSQKLDEMENFYSLAGINFGNIQKNETLILTKITQLENDGWHLERVSTGTQSPSEGYAQGIYMTRYLFKR